CYFLFFFQAEDGIRDFHVTGVQTCALPIWSATTSRRGRRGTTGRTRWTPAWRPCGRRSPRSGGASPRVVGASRRRWAKGRSAGSRRWAAARAGGPPAKRPRAAPRSEEHTSELQSRENLVCRLLL